MTDSMYESTYWAVQKILDRALGTEESDGVGEGIAADVQLLVDQRDAARAAGFAEAIALLRNDLGRRLWAERVLDAYQQSFLNSHMAGEVRELLGHYLAAHQPTPTTEETT
jgi:hypothetical protein